MCRIDEMRARCEAATPGPWNVDCKRGQGPNMHICHEGVGWPMAGMWTGMRGWEVAEKDADFIAHSRKDIPYLLGEVERLTAEVIQCHEAEMTYLLDDWSEDDGAVLWWRFPIDEPPYCGTPLDDLWPGYHTHWSPLPQKLAVNGLIVWLDRRAEAESAVKGDAEC